MRSRVPLCALFSPENVWVEAAGSEGVKVHHKNVLILMHSAEHLSMYYVKSQQSPSRWFHEKGRIKKLIQSQPDEEK